MAKKKNAKTAGKMAAPGPPNAAAVAVDDIGSGLYHLAKATQGIADELDSIKYKFEEMTEALNNISGSIDSSGRVAEFAIIAQHGSDEDRATIVEHLKKSNYTVFPDA